MRSSVRSRLAPPYFQSLRRTPNPESVPFCSKTSIKPAGFASKLRHKHRRKVTGEQQRRPCQTAVRNRDLSVRPVSAPVPTDQRTHEWKLCTFAWQQNICVDSAHPSVDATWTRSGRPTALTGRAGMIFICNLPQNKCAFPEVSNSGNSV